MPAALSDKSLSITMRAMPVFFAFVTLRAVVIGHRYDRWIPAITAVVLMALLILISDPAWMKRTLHRVVPIVGIGPIRFLFALVFFAALLVLRFAVPPSYSGAILVIFVPAFLLSYVVPGFVFREVAGLAVQTRPRLKDVPMTKLDPVVYWWVKPAAWLIVALLAVGFYGFLISNILPSGSWTAVSIALAVLLAVQSGIVIVWFSWKTREGQIEDVRKYIPDFIFLGVVGGGFIALMSYFAVSNVVPSVWHALSRPAILQSEYVIKRADPRSGIKGCRAMLVVFRKGRPDNTARMCGGSADFVAKARRGDRLLVEGPASALGQSIDTLTILR